MNESAERAAWQDLYAAVPAPLGARLGVAAHPIRGGMAGVVARLDVLTLNRAFGFGRDTDPGALIGLYRAAGVRRFMAAVAPGDDAAAVAHGLQRHGFVHHNNWVKLVRRDGAVDAVAADLRIAPLEAADAGEAGRLIVAAFEWPEPLGDWFAATVTRPRWQWRGAFDGARLVAVAGMFVHGAAAWLSFASTASDARGRGAQSALIAERIRAGLALGCTRFEVETTEPRPDRPVASHRNLLRAGFVPAYSRPNYRWTAE